MKSVAIYGAGGFGREVKGMMDNHSNYSAVGFIDDFKNEIEKLNENQFDDILIAIADPTVRCQIVKNWYRKNVPFNPFINKNVVIHHSTQLGRGSIICPGVQITVDVRIGEFVIINLNTTIGHDVVIGDFCSIMPSVNISGDVSLGDRVYVGSGAIILQGLTIGDDVVIGAGSVVTHDIEKGKVVKGVPAKY